SKRDWSSDVCSSDLPRRPFGSHVVNSTVSEPRTGTTMYPSCCLQIFAEFYVSLIVQKFGGSSVADAESIARVAERIASTKREGHDVVVVVSAMGDTTDELIDLAAALSEHPPTREMDILLTAGERISMALLAIAISGHGVRAKAFTGQQAGRITDNATGQARILNGNTQQDADTLAGAGVIKVARD